MPKQFPCLQHHSLNYGLVEQARMFTVHVDNFTDPASEKSYKGYAIILIPLVPQIKEFNKMYNLP